MNGPQYLGKLVPGLRESGLAPVPVTTVDGVDLPWKMVNGVKEFDLIVEPVTREFLPGFPMELWGYNGSMPGPTIQAFQGDRVRINVHNRLPEMTTVHWHGLELPNRYDGIPGVTQPPIKPGETFVYEFDLHQSGRFLHHSSEDRVRSTGRSRLCARIPKFLHSTERQYSRFLGHGLELAHHQRTVRSVHNAPGLQARRTG